MISLDYKRYTTKNERSKPYNYPKVRGNGGKIKSVYLGTEQFNNKKRGKFVQKPNQFLFFIVLLIFLIIAGSLFFLVQNRVGFLSEEIKENEPKFEVDQTLIKVLIKQGGFIDKQIRVMNTGEDESSFEIKAEGLDMVDVKDPFFSIKPGQTKSINLNFNSVLKDQEIEQAPGVYIGKLIVYSNGLLRKIPVIVEIESKTVLFDINLNPNSKEGRIPQGQEANIEVRLFNLEGIEPVNVEMNYFVRDLEGNTIITETESVVVKTQASFFKTLKIPLNLGAKDYVFVVHAEYGSSVATSSYLFEVVNVKADKEFKIAGFCSNDVLCWTLSLALIFVLFSFGAYVYHKLTGGFARITGRVPAVELKEVKAKGKDRVNGILRIYRARGRESKKKRLEKRRKREKERGNEKRRKEDERKKLESLRKVEEREKEFLKLRIEIERSRERKQEEEERKEREAKKERLRKEKENERKNVEEYRIRQKEESRRNKELEKVNLEKLKEDVMKKKELEIKRAEEEKRQRKIEEGRLKEEKLREKEMLKEQRESERKRRKKEQLEREKVRELKKKLIKKIVKKKTIDFLYSAGLYKTKREKAKLEKLRENVIKKKELEIKRAEEEKRQRKIEEGRLKEEKLREKERLREQRESEMKKVEEDRIRQKEEYRRKKEIEKLKSEKQRKGEGKRGKEEHVKKPKEKVMLKKRIEGKSRKFVKCHNMLLKIKSLMNEGKMDAAKGLYPKTRELYTKLPYEEKKDIYDEFMDVYSRLSS